MGSRWTFWREVSFSLQLDVRFHPQWLAQVVSLGETQNGLARAHFGNRNDRRFCSTTHSHII